MELPAKVTDFLSHAQEEVTTTPKGHRPRIDTKKTTVVVHRWKRMATQIHLWNQHASSGVIMYHLDQMRDRIEEDAVKAWYRATGWDFQPKARAQKSKKPKNSDSSKGNILGDPLSCSTAKRWSYGPAMCTHDEKSIDGSGKAFWFACTRCEWERLSVEQVASRSGPFSPATPLVPGQETTTAAAVMPPLEREIGAGLIRGHNMLITPKAARSMRMNVARNMSDTASTRSTEDSWSTTTQSEATAPSEVSSRDTRRKTNNFQMVELSPMRQAAFEKYQQLYKEDASNEVVLQKMMQLGATPQEIAAVLEVIQHQQA